ncbi:hypothetical protein [Ktedonobacter racemifer]|uniref:Uncharacterized protein n=1 Tax=Ktedonobacter racemifer DSM 44963 TaxID=485913 RepID=D6TKK2_KTERA|nr:hypothetical protein [Ktedonobacter racemifer]EFH86302.1 hypothetical protein Krac_7594 [Ktedonobacter racemifer DSM 44963]
MMTEHMLLRFTGHAALVRPRGFVRSDCYALPAACFAFCAPGVGIGAFQADICLAAQGSGMPISGGGPPVERDR